MFDKRSLLLLAFLTTISARLPAATAAPARPGWKLVWSDEFDTDGAPDPKKWGCEHGFLRNGELQYYTSRPENARVEHGQLVIEGRKEHFVDPAPAKNGKPPKPAEYTSASLTTENTASWTYGRFEVRAKLPQGRGTWPAIWLLGKNIHQAGWPKCGEIDIMENVGFDPDGIHTTIHTESSNHVKHTEKSHTVTVSRPFDDFHVYAAEWTHEAIRFFVDEKQVFAYANDGSGEAAWPFDKPQFLILNFAIGGAWGGAKGVDAGIFPQKYCIKYVRVYQKDAAAKTP